MSRLERDRTRYAQRLVDMVADGDLPPEALLAIKADNALLFDIDRDGRISDQTVTRFDLDDDGKREKVTENDLLLEYNRRLDSAPGGD